MTSFIVDCVIYTYVHAYVCTRTDSIPTSCTRFIARLYHHRWSKAVRNRVVNRAVKPAREVGPIISPHRTLGTRKKLTTAIKSTRRPGCNWPYRCFVYWRTSIAHLTPILRWRRVKRSKWWRRNYYSCYVISRAMTILWAASLDIFCFGHISVL